MVWESVKKKKGGGGEGTKLTESVGGIDGKEKAGETDAMGDRCPAIHVERLIDGNIVQGSEHTLGAKCLSSADCGHSLFCEGATFSDVFEREPG